MRAGVPKHVHDALSFPEQLIMSDFLTRLKEAEKKHPVFAEGPYQALGVLAEEFGETTRAVTKGEGDERVYDEALDLLVVVWRFTRGDWK